MLRAILFGFERQACGVAQQVDLARRERIAQQPDGVGPAARAVAHLGQIFLAGLSYFLHRLLVRLRNMGERGVDIREHRHAVQQIHVHLLHPGGHRLDMVIVDTGDDDAVDLDRDPESLQLFYGRQLPGKKQAGSFQAAVDDVPVADPAIDPLADLRIHRTDGDGDVGDLDLGQCLDIRADSHAVGRDAEQHFGKLPPDRAQGRHRLIPIGERIAGTGDPCD